MKSSLQFKNRPDTWPSLASSDSRAIKRLDSLQYVLATVLSPSRSDRWCSSIEGRASTPRVNTVRRSLSSWASAIDESAVGSVSRRRPVVPAVVVECGWLTATAESSGSGAASDDRFGPATSAIRLDVGQVCPTASRMPINNAAVAEMAVDAGQIQDHRRAAAEGCSTEA